MAMMFVWSRRTVAHTLALYDNECEYVGVGKYVNVDFLREERAKSFHFAHR